MHFFKKNFSLIAAISLPIILTLAIAGAIYLPRTSTTPEYNFLYAVNNEPYPSSAQYRVIGNRLQKFEATQTEPILPKPLMQGESEQPTIEPQLYVHNTQTNTSESINFEVASQLSLIPGNTSPDGFRITRGDESFSLLSALFGGRSNYNTQFLIKGNTAVDLNLATNPDYYYNFNFLGWIEK